MALYCDFLDILCTEVLTITVLWLYKVISDCLSWCVFLFAQLLFIDVVLGVWKGWFWRLRGNSDSQLTQHCCMAGADVIFIAAASLPPFVKNGDNLEASKLPFCLRYNNVFENDINENHRQVTGLSEFKALVKTTWFTVKWKKQTTWSEHFHVCTKLPKSKKVLCFPAVSTSGAQGNCSFSADLLNKQRVERQTQSLPSRHDRLDIWCTVPVTI